MKRIEVPDFVSRLAGGQWIDRSTAGSPLIWDGLAYHCDIYQMLYIIELSTGQLLDWQPLPLDGLMHYNSVPVAASATLIGKHIFVCDNQGTTAVIQPGHKYHLLSRNKIATVLDRGRPIPAQETLTYSPPIADGGRIYLRGEAFMYCIGEK